MPVLETHDEAESHSAQSNTLNESGCKDHVAHDITFRLGLAGDAFQGAATDAAYAEACAYSSETGTDHGACFCNGHAGIRSGLEKEIESGHRNED